MRYSPYPKPNSTLLDKNDSLTNVVGPEELGEAKENAPELGSVDFLKLINEYLEELNKENKDNLNIKGEECEPKEDENIFPPPVKSSEPEPVMDHLNTHTASRLSRSQNWSKLDQSTIQNVEVVHNRVLMSVPEKVQCHLCREGVMFIKIRKILYRGTPKEYPTYRCAKKSCQTFCSIGKIVGPNPGSKSKSVKSPQQKSE